MMVPLSFSKSKTIPLQQMLGLLGICFGKIRPQHQYFIAHKTPFMIDSRPTYKINYKSIKMREKLSKHMYKKIICKIF